MQKIKSWWKQKQQERADYLAPENEEYRKQVQDQSGQSFMNPLIGLQRVSKTYNKIDETFQKIHMAGNNLTYDLIGRDEKDREYFWPNNFIGTKHDYAIKLVEDRTGINIPNLMSYALNKASQLSKPIPEQKSTIGKRGGRMLNNDEYLGIEQITNKRIKTV